MKTPDEIRRRRVAVLESALHFAPNFARKRGGKFRHLLNGGISTNLSESGSTNAGALRVSSLLSGICTILCLRVQCLAEIIRDFLSAQVEINAGRLPIARGDHCL